MICGTDVPDDLWDVVYNSSLYKGDNCLLTHVPRDAEELWRAIVEDVKSIIGGWNYSPSVRMPSALAPVYADAWALVTDPLCIREVATTSCYV